MADVRRASFVDVAVCKAVVTREAALYLEGGGGVILPVEKFVTWCRKLSFCVALARATIESDMIDCNNRLRSL
jgi:hypothetical protein